MATGEGASRRFGILGALQVHLDGRSIPITAGKARVVVAALLIQANQPVGTETLIDYIWEEPPRSARTVLHSLILRLRRAFGTHGVIQTYESGYLIEVGPGELDLDVFQGLLTDAEQARRVQDLATERAHLAEALELWRGPALVDVPSRSLQLGEAERLHEFKFTALSRRIDLDLMFGAHGEVVGELRRLTRAQPLRERLWAQLMTALYRCGRQAEALAAYQDVRQVLGEELGIEPGSELSDLHQAILVGDPHLAAPVVQDFAHMHSEPWRELCQLPSVAGDFTGRQTDHDLLVERLSAEEGNGSVVIWGTPGIGKTALAVRIAHSLRPVFPGGQWYIALQANAPSLAGPVDPAAVLAELLVASGVPRAAVPRGLQARAAAWRARLADRRILLVLDDALDIDQVLALLPGTATCAVLITSRSAMTALPGSYHHRLNQLDSADAVSMLGQIIGDYRVHAEPRAARRIAELCGGLPLALRILGARLTTQPAQRLAILADRLASDRHRLNELEEQSTAGITVRAELRISCEGLDPDTRRAFRHLGLLPDGDFAAWTLGALTDGSDGQRLVERLTVAGLLDPTAADATGEPRYRAHDLVALYAREQAPADPAVTRDAIGRLLTALISRAWAIRPRTPQLLEAMPPGESSTVHTPDTAAQLIEDPDTWVHTERRLLLSTIEQGCRVGHHQEAALLGTLTIPTLVRLGGFTRLHHIIATVFQAALEHGDERVAWRAEYGRAMLALTSELREATAVLARCAEAFERLDARTELAYSLAGLAFARSLRSVCDEASAERAVQIAHTTDQPALKALTLRSHADVLAASGRPEHARPLYEKALEHVRELDTPQAESDILLRYGRCVLTLGDLGNAAAVCDSAIELVTGRHNDHDLAWCLSLRSRIQLRVGNRHEARKTAQRARTLMIQAGDIRGSATVCLDLAAAHLAMGEQREAIIVLGQALPVLHDTGAHNAAAQAKQLLQRAHGNRAPYKA